MIRFIFAVLLFVNVGVAHSSAEGCENNYEIARMTMKHRQDGFSIVSQYEVLDYIKDNSKGEKGYEKHYKTMENMIIKAYETPRYSLKENQERAIADFSDYWFLRCKKFELSNQ